MGAVFLICFWATIASILLSLGLFGSLFVAWVYDITTLNTGAILLAGWIFLSLSTVSVIGLAGYTFLCMSRRRRIALLRQIPPPAAEPAQPFILSEK